MTLVCVNLTKNYHSSELFFSFCLSGKFPHKESRTQSIGSIYGGQLPTLNMDSESVVFSVMKLCIQNQCGNEPRQHTENRPTGVLPFHSLCLTPDNPVVVPCLAWSTRTGCTAVSNQTKALEPGSCRTPLSAYSRAMRAGGK